MLGDAVMLAKHKNVVTDRYIVKYKFPTYTN